MTGLIGGVLGFGLAFIALGAWQYATSRRRLNRATAQAVALTQPPAREAPAPAPAPGSLILTTPAGCSWCTFHLVEVTNWSGQMWGLERCPAHEPERQP